MDFLAARTERLINKSRLFITCGVAAPIFFQHTTPGENESDPVQKPTCETNNETSTTDFSDSVERKMHASPDDKLRSSARV